MKFAIISDIHEDIQRLEIALKKISKIGVDKKICLGDILGYGDHQKRFYPQSDTKELIELVQSSFDNIVLGNHDFHHLKITPPDCDGIHFPDNWHQLPLPKKKSIAKDKIWYHSDDIEPVLSPVNIQFLKNYTQPFGLSGKGQMILFSHYLFPNYTGIHKAFYLSANELSLHFLHLKKHQQTLSFAGHGHPNGLAVFTKKHMQMIKFGACTLSGQLTAVVCPSVSKSERFNGFITFDSTSKMIEIYTLDS